MAELPPIVSPGAPVEPVTLDGYTVVTLKRSVEVAGHLYRPGIRHTVDAATLDAMGDAVLTSVPAA